ncbi:hypothetical protein [Paenibacillus sp. MMS20-IR301]|uniref:hypothetical protein n=1 Tax=Paenibacillus sp. MMS20-IR301 TaxID=2895946 RepID=UPI0028E6C399|nr:hypothetical protein [Paenibacillus sp. MMS20-IR301]WNS45888.1 hypothetical protein LOS79_11640 [Paenibacillus sp. MMS20-IR301]
MSIRRILFILAALVVAGFGVYNFIAYSERLTPATNLAGETIGGVKLHDHITDSHLLKQYGSPLSQDDNELYDYYHWKGGLVTASVHSGPDEGDIMRIMITPADTNRSDDPLHTAFGIGLGDSKQSVLDLYGTKYYKSNEQTADIIGYIDHKLGITLEFWCDPSGTVAEIRLDDVSMR